MTPEMEPALVELDERLATARDVGRQRVSRPVQVGRGADCAGCRRSHRLFPRRRDRARPRTPLVLGRTSTSFGRQLLLVILWCGDAGVVGTGNHSARPPIMAARDDTRPGRCCLVHAHVQHCCHIGGGITITNGSRSPPLRLLRFSRRRRSRPPIQRRDVRARSGVVVLRRQVVKFWVVIISGQVNRSHFAGKTARISRPARSSDQRRDRASALRSALSRIHRCELPRVPLGLGTTPGSIRKSSAAAMKLDPL